MTYIGIDLHAGHFSMAVLNQDDSTMFEETLPSSSQNLTTAVGVFSETKSVVSEESTLAAWAYRVLQPCAEKVVVADPLHNLWIAGDEKSNNIPYPSPREDTLLLTGKSHNVLLNLVR